MPSSNNTATFAFAGWGSPWVPKVISISPPGYTLESLGDDDLSTTGFKELLPADLQEIGELNIVVRLPGDSARRFDALMVSNMFNSGVTMNTTVASLTISWPAGTSGDNTDPTLVGTAFCTGWEPSEMNNDEQQTAVINFQFDGKTGPTYVVGAA